MVQEEAKQDLRIPAKRGSSVSQRGKKDRHEGRPINIILRNNEREPLAGNVGAGSRSLFLMHYLVG